MQLPLKKGCQLLVWHVNGNGANQSVSVWERRVPSCSPRIWSLQWKIHVCHGSMITWKPVCTAWLRVHLDLNHLWNHSVMRSPLCTKPCPSKFKMIRWSLIAGRLESVWRSSKWRLARSCPQPTLAYANSNEVCYIFLSVIFFFLYRFATVGRALYYEKNHWMTYPELVVADPSEDKRFQELVLILNPMLEDILGLNQLWELSSVWVHHFLCVKLHLLLYDRK